MAGRPNLAEWPLYGPAVGIVRLLSEEFPAPEIEIESLLAGVWR
jgi:hypothetical protein